MSPGKGTRNAFAPAEAVVTHTGDRKPDGTVTQQK